MKTRSNRINEKAVEGSTAARVSDKVTFLLAVTSLLAVALVSVFLETPFVFFLTNLIFALSIVAIVTANKFLVTMTSASASIFVAATIYDGWHVFVLVPVVIVIILYWKHVSPIGVVVCVSFYIIYGLVIYQTFGAPIYFWCILVVFPAHLTYGILFGAFVKEKGNMASWI